MLVWLNPIDIVANNAQKLADIERFGQEAVSFDFGGTLGGVSSGGDDHNRGVRARLAAVQLGKGPAVHDRHAHVEQDEIRERSANEFEGDGAIGGRRNGVALGVERELYQTADAFVVVDNEDGAG